MEQETKKKKSGLRKAMLPALAMLLASVLSLTTMTYAWFTSGEEANVENFDLTIAAGGGLEISATGKEDDWLSTLDIASLKTQNTGFASFLDSGKTLDPVSTNGKYGTDMALKFYKGQIESAAPGAKLKQSSEASEGWVEFNLFFRNASANALKINLTGTAVTAKSTENVSEPEGHLAVRMAFVITGTGAAHASGEVTDKSEGGTATIFEPNATEHTNPGIADQTAGAPDQAHTGKFAYNALVKEFNYPTGEESALDRYKAEDSNGVLEAVTTQTEAAYEDGFFTLEKESITKVKVYLWIEGQDADCTNYISSNAFTTQLKFLGVVAGD